MCQSHGAQHPLLGYLGVGRGPRQSREGAELLFSPCIHSIYPTTGRKQQTPGRSVPAERHEALPPPLVNPNSMFVFFLLQAYTIQGQYAIPHPDVSFTLIFLIPFYVTCMLLLIHKILILDNNINSTFSK